MQGCFITLEGIDGTGKTTQARLLVEALKSGGHEVVHTREPGGTALGNRLRRLLLESDEQAIGATAEMLLMAADRAQHVDEIIRPALSAGKIVVSERYIDSSLAYQGAAGLSVGDIGRVNAVATGGLMPAITFLFDADPKQAFRRTQSDRIEGRSLEYHRRVRSAFQAISKADPKRVHLVSVVGKTPEAIHAMLMQKVEDYLLTSAQ